MATLLMIESWLQSTGQVLPPLLDRLGHEYVLVTRDPGTYGAGSAAPHPALSGAADVVVVETNATDTTVDRAAAVAAERRIDGVITTCDHDLATPRPSPSASACRARRPRPCAVAQGS
jgi:argininosuccinate lyase